MGHSNRNRDKKVFRTHGISQCLISLYSLFKNQICNLQDYVRAGCVSSINSDLFLSGSFDHTVKLYDAREPKSSTISVDHGAPVESVLMYPGNSIFVSVGNKP